MGAGVAASPHCPLRMGARPGRRGGPRGRFRGAKPSRGQGRIPQGSFRRLSAFRLPRGLPVRAEALAVRRSADPGKTLGFPSRRRRRPQACASDPLRRGSGQAGGPPDRSGPKPLNLPLRSSRAEARSCPTQAEPEGPPRPVAARRLSSRFCRTGRSPRTLPVCRFPARRLANRWALYEACRFRIR